MTERQRRGFIIGISAGFVLLNTVLIALEVFWLNLLPLAVLILVMYFWSLEKVFLGIAFLTPLSVDIQVRDLGMNITLPTEPLLMGMLLLLVLKMLYQNPFPRAIWKHPVSIIIILNLAWMFLTSITSEMPDVSFKYLVMQLWFIVPVYFFGLMVFKQERPIRIFLILLLSAVAITVIYTTYLHAQLGFDGQAAHWVMWPFYNDHTAYGAVLAFVFPIGVVLTLDHQYSRTIRLFFALLAFIILMGLVLSVSRAAWLSTLAAAGFFVIMYYRIKFKTLLLGGLVMVSLLFVFQDRIITRMEKNTQESEETDLAKHARSMSNITTDASNLERLNRWSAALRMIQERPVLGWGPGTYQFVYAPYQKSTDLTIISTNFGDLGSVHSEYIGPACSSGILGSILFFALVISVIALTLRLLHQDIPSRLRWYLMAVFLGLTTYYVHGFLNNFLDTDKASIPFWGYTAILVAIDLYHKKQVKGKPEESPPHAIQ